MGGSHGTVYQGHGPSGWACSATMGGACGRLNPTRTLVVIGLDASGKSTILSNFTEHDVSAYCVLQLWRPGLRLVFKARGTADTACVCCTSVRRRRGGVQHGLGVSDVSSTPGLKLEHISVAGVVRLTSCHTRDRCRVSASP